MMRERIATQSLMVDTSSNYLNARSQNHTEVSNPSPTRGKRLQDSNQNIQNLFLRSAAQDQASVGKRNADFPFRVPTEASSSANAAQRGDNESTGRISGGESGLGSNFQRSGSGAVDARFLGAARPAGNAPRFTIRREATGGRGDQNIQSARPGIDVALGPRPRLFSRPDASLQAATNSSSGQIRSRPKKSKSGGDRSRGAGGAGGGSKKDEREYDEMMKRYETERNQASIPTDSAFEPKSPEEMLLDLQKTGPAIITGELGIHGLLAQKKKSAEWYETGQREIEHRYLWDSFKHRKHVFAMRNGLNQAAGVEQSDSVVKAGKKGDMNASKKRPELLDVLFSGAYMSGRPQLEHHDADVMSFVGSQAARNPSFERGDEHNLMNKVRKIVAPVPQASASARPVANKQ